MVGGSFQPLISISGGEFENFGSPIEIVEVPENGSVFLEIAGNIFESISNYAENINATFTTKIIDKAGNETQGLSDGTIIHVDEIIPTLDSIGISTIMRLVATGQPLQIILLSNGYPMKD